MTNEAQELIAQARELCERKIAEWQEVFDEASKYSDAQHQRDEINSWTTHLAEMDEHYNNFVEGNYNLAESVEGWFCQGCYERNDSDTPCQKLLTKAKRLLGVSK